jgi:hypothetical protein
MSGSTRRGGHKNRALPGKNIDRGRHIVSDVAKRILVLVLNLVFAAILGFAEIFGWGMGWVGPIGLIIAIVLDTWLGIEWIPPKKPSDSTRGTG